jgi:hypothetical protein
MYENITYAELKNLPKEQKADAWKELKGLYSTQKELAEKLGVSPNLVYNMISRYVKDESAGTEKVEIPEAVELPKKARSRVKKQDRQEQDNIVTDSSDPVQEIKASEENESFSIAIKKVVTGEDAQFFLNGIGSTLLKNQKYQIEVKITEK